MMSIPFILTNFFVYLAFIIILITYETAISNPDTEKIVNQVYNSAISFIALCAVVLFLVLGLHVGVTTARHSEKVKSITLFKIFVVPLGFSLSLVIQCAFLLWVSFDSQSLDVWVAIFYYAVAELFPGLMLLLILWKPPSRKLKQSKTTRKSVTDEAHEVLSRTYISQESVMSTETKGNTDSESDNEIQRVSLNRDRRDSWSTSKSASSEDDDNDDQDDKRESLGTSRSFDKYMPLPSLSVLWVLTPNMYDNREERDNGQRWSTSRSNSSDEEMQSESSEEEVERRYKRL